MRSDYRRHWMAAGLLSLVSGGSLALGAQASVAPSSAGSDLRRGHFCQTLDPRQTRVAECAQLMMDLYEGLVRVGPDGHLEPGVAVSWEFDTEQQRITFFLDPKRRWSDGQPVVAADFITSWTSSLASDTFGNILLSWLLQIQGAEAVRAQRAEQVSGLVALNDHTLQIDFDQFDHAFPLRAIQGGLLPIPAHAYRKHGSDWHEREDAPFNGFYRIDQRRPARRYRLVPNAHHPERQRVSFAQVDYFYINPQSYLSLQEFRRLVASERSEARGVPDVAIVNRHLSDQALKALNGQGWQSVFYEGAASYFLLANQQGLGAEVIEALKLILYSPEYFSRSPQRSGRATRRLVNLQSGFPLPRVDNPFDLPRTTRHQRASALLEQQGISATQPRVLHLSVLTQRARLFNLATANALLAPFGLSLELKHYPTAEAYVENLEKTFGDLVFVSVFLPFNDPSGFFHPIFLAQHSVLSSSDREQFHALIAQASESQEAERLLYLAQAEQLLIEQGGVIPLIQPQSLMLFRQGLCNVYPSAGRKVLSAWIKPCS